MRTVVISDLHLGDRHSRVADLHRLLQGLPPDVELVLNGDVMDRNRRILRPEHQRVLDLIGEQATRRPVVWVRGNHDDTFEWPEAPAGLRFCQRHAVDTRLLVMHGHDFENIMPMARPIMWLLCSLHALRIALGAEAIHVALYAKRFPALYRLLRRRVSSNAVAYARAHGFPAVTCGHTHYLETLMQDGITYYNTGAWTEPVAGCLFVDTESISLKSFAAGAAMAPGGGSA